MAKEAALAASRRRDQAYETRQAAIDNAKQRNMEAAMQSVLHARASMQRSDQKTSNNADFYKERAHAIAQARAEEQAFREEQKRRDAEDRAALIQERANAARQAREERVAYQEMKARSLLRQTTLFLLTLRCARPTSQSRPPG